MIIQRMNIALLAPTRCTCRHVPTSRALPPRHLRLSTATIEASEEDAERQVDHLHQAAEEQLHAQSGGASGIKNVHLTIEIPQGARPGQILQSRSSHVQGPFTFTVPPNSKPGDLVRLALMLGEGGTLLNQSDLPMITPEQATGRLQAQERQQRHREQEREEEQLLGSLQEA